MEIQIKTDNKEKSPMLERISKLKPKFSSNKEALDFYTNKLEILASSVNMSIEDLLHQAETSETHKDEHIDALVCAKRITAFRR